MVVMIYMGKPTEKIINTLKTQNDAIDCMSFKGVDDFIHQCELRHLVFDRLIFTYSFVKSEDGMAKLRDYVKMNASSVEIVMLITKPKNPEDEAKTAKQRDVFVKYFDSPLYVVYAIASPTVKTILTAVKSPIVNLKAVDEIEGSEAAQPSSPKGSFFGKKNNSEKSGNDSPSKESVKDVENVSSDVVSDSSDSSLVSAFQPNENSSGFVQELENLKSDSSENSSVFSDTSVSDGENSDFGMFSGGSFDELDLSVGSFGSQHSDSGFVGDDELDELEEFNRLRNSGSVSGIPTPVEPVSPVSTPIVDVPPVSNTIEKGSMPDGEGISDSHSVSVGSDRVKNLTLSKKPEIKKDSPIDISKKGTSTVVPEEVVSAPFVQKSNYSDPCIEEGKVNIVTGLSGSGATAYVISKAVDAVKIGKKVLIIDLDTNSNGILSFIDSSSFYEKGCNRGIQKGKLYFEDGVDILSNGYGEEVGSYVNKILTAMSQKYDIVLVDCPVDCLSVISDKVFCSSNIIVCTISDVSKLIETSSAFYDRNYISLPKEIYISKNCKISNKNISMSDIEFVKKCVLFTNGCWLDNI